MRRTICSDDADRLGDLLRTTHGGHGADDPGYGADVTGHTAQATAIGHDATIAATYAGVSDDEECVAILAFCDAHEDEFVLQTRNSLVYKFHSTEPRLAAELLRRLRRHAPHLDTK